MPAQANPLGPTINGWLVLFGPVFAEHYAALRDEARALKDRLPPEEFERHPRVELFAAVRRLVLEILPQDPNADEFQLWGELGRFRRAKGHGLPDRYRLFYAFSTQAKAIILLYLNDAETLRKAGARSDPYNVFKQLLAKGLIGRDFEENYRIWKDHEKSADARQRSRR